LLGGKTKTGTTETMVGGNPFPWVSIQNYSRKGRGVKQKLSEASAFYNLFWRESLGFFTLILFYLFF
jgi:hypothetical protein